MSSHRLLFYLSNTNTFINEKGGGLGFFNVSRESIFSSPCQRQSELMPSLVVRRLSSVNFSHFNILFSKPCQRQYELLSSLGVPVVCHPFTFHILIFSSENPQPNELKLGKKHLWKVLSKEFTFCYDPLSKIYLFLKLFLF